MFFNKYLGIYKASMDYFYMNQKKRKKRMWKKIVWLIKNKCEVNFSQELIDRAVILWKATEDKERPLLIGLKEETKKHEIFQNLNKIRDAGTPFNKVITWLY